MIHYIQLQPALAPVVFCFPPTFQLILTAAHDEEPNIGPRDDPVKIRHLHISFQHDLFLASKRATCRIRQCLDPPPPGLNLFQLCLSLLDLLQSRLVRRHSRMDLLPPA